MDILTLDFETFYSKEFSLSKMTTEAYVNDFRFEVIGVAVKRNNEATQWFTGTFEETAEWFTQFDWDNSLVVAHNAMFDGAILGWRFGIHPKAIICTLSMARALHAVSVGGSLAALSEYYELGKKGTEVHDALGKRRLDFSEAEINAYGGYCVNDVELTYTLFNTMKPKFTTAELKLIDITIRMYTDPQLLLDKAELEAHLIEVQQQKEQLLLDCGISKEDLMSNQKFATVLESFGVEPPMKLNSKGVETYAFAKTDDGFKALAEHDDVRVQTIVAARLGTKSTLEETRTQRFIEIADRPLRHGLLPVPLLYYGARTGRWSATDKVNLQNLPRKSRLKKAIVAPEGYVIVGADLSAIELRLGLAFGGQMDKVEALGRGVDLYKDFASTVYNIPYDTVDDTQRFMGKTCIAEGELVLTDRGLVPIQNVKIDDKVWDGLEWVNHDGLIYQGEKDVITYQGLTATPDHIVYLSDGAKCEFQKAASENYSIAITGDDRGEVQFMGDSLARYMQKRQQESSTHSCNVPLWEKGLAGSRQSIIGEEQTMPPMFIDTATWTSTTSTGSGRADAEATETCQCDVSKMQQSKRQWVQELRSTGGGVSIRLDSIMRGILEKLTLLLNVFISGPHRQQRALHTWKSSVCYSSGTNEQQAQYYDGKLEGEYYPSNRMDAEPLSPRFNSLQVHTPRDDRRRYSSQSMGISTQQTQRMAQVKRKVRVYDLLNAGARHRFTVNNLLVSNCQLSLIYGTGHNKLRQQTKQMSGIDMGEAEAKRMVSLYRNEYTHVVDTWGQGDQVLHAVRNNQFMRMGRNNIIEVHGSEGALLPSKLYMRYPDLKQTIVQTTKGQRTEWSVLKNRRERDKLYGSKVFQGLTQAMARCIIAEAMLRIEKKYRILLTIHDAVYLLAPEDKADVVLRFVIEQLRVPPVWMPDIPLDAEGGFGRSLDFKMGKIK